MALMFVVTGVRIPTDVTETGLQVRVMKVMMLLTSEA
jgi:hypothetical protein